MPAVVLLTLLALAIFAVGLAQPLLIASYIARLAVALALLAALTFGLLPRAERACAWIGPPQIVRALWGITLLACAVRLAGSLYPLFFGFDLGLNTDRLIQNLSGQLVITRRSIEFHNGITIYPPGPYLAFMPSLLLGLAPAMVVQASMALFDGLAAFAVGALARALGAGPRAALLAALLYAAVPVGLTGLWFGLTAQVFGQALMAPLALAALAAFREPQRWRRWAVAGALLGMATLSHIGVTIVAFVWLGLAWLLLARRSATAGLAAVCAGPGGHRRAGRGAAVYRRGCAQDPAARHDWARYRQRGVPADLRPDLARLPQRLSPAGALADAARR